MSSASSPGGRLHGNDANSPSPPSAGRSNVRYVEYGGVRSWDNGAGDDCSVTAASDSVTSYTATSSSRSANTQQLLAAAEMGMAVAEEERDRLRCELDRCKADMSVLRHQLESQKQGTSPTHTTSIGTPGDPLNATNSTQARQQTRIQELEALVARGNTERQQLLDDVNELADAMALAKRDLEADKAALAAQLAAAQAVSTPNRSHPPGVGLRSEYTKEQICRALLAVGELRQELLGLRSSVGAQVMQRVKIFADERTSLQEALQAARSDVQDLLLTVHRTEERCARLHTEFEYDTAALTEENHLLQRRVNEQMAQLETLVVTCRCRKQESSCTNLAATHRVPDPARAPRDAHVRMLEQQLAEARATILHLERDGASVRGAALRLAQEHRQHCHELDRTTLDHVKAQAVAQGENATELSRMEAELISSRARADALTQQIHALRTELQAKQALAARVMELERRLVASESMHIASSGQSDAHRAEQDEQHQWAMKVLRLNEALVHELRSVYTKVAALEAEVARDRTDVSDGARNSHYRAGVLRNAFDNMDRVMQSVSLERHV